MRSCRRASRSSRRPFAHRSSPCHRRLEDDRVFGLVELVGRPKREVSDHVEVARKELLELVAALDVELAGEDLRILRVVVVDEPVDVLVEEVLDVALVEAKVGGVEIFHRLPHFPMTSTSLSPNAEDDSTDRAVTKGWSYSTRGFSRDVLGSESTFPSGPTASSTMTASG